MPAVELEQHDDHCEYMGLLVYLRSVEMNRGDFAMAHKAKWDLISSMVSSSLNGSPICSKKKALCYQPPLSKSHACWSLHCPFLIKIPGHQSLRKVTGDIHGVYYARSNRGAA